MEYILQLFSVSKLRGEITSARKERAVVVFLAFQLAIVLIVAYKYVVSPVCSLESLSYGSRGYPYRDLDLWLIITAIITAVLPSTWIPIKLMRPSQMLYWLLYILVIVPTMIFPLFDLTLSPFKILMHNAVLLFAFYLLSRIYALPMARIPDVKLPPKWFWVGLTVMSLSFYAYLIYYFGIRLMGSLSHTVSDLRIAYKDVLKTSGKFLDVAIGWQANIANQFLIILGMLDRKLLLLMLGCLCQIVIYATTGFKSYLISFFLLFVVLLSLERNGKKYGYLFLVGFICMILFGVIIDSTMNFISGQLNPLFTSLFVRRGIVLQGLLSGYYYDFFSQHPKALLGGGILKGIVHYPYDLPIPNLIGKHYFDNPNTHANVNYLMDAYANFGYAGVFLFTAFVGFYLWIFDSIAQNHDIRLSTLILAAPASTLCGSPLIASFVYSMLPALLLILVLPVSILQQHGAPLESDDHTAAM